MYHPSSQHSMRKKKILSTLLVKPQKTVNYSFTLLVLFFLQLVSDLSVQIYGTNLVTLGYSHRKGFAFLTYLSPFLIVVAPFRTKLLHLRAPAIALFAGLALCSFRAAASFLNEESGRFLFDTLGILSFWLYLPCRMAASTMPWTTFKMKRHPRLCCSRALSIALVVIITFRTIGGTLDGSIVPPSSHNSNLERIFAAVLAGAGVILLFLDYLFGDRSRKRKQGRLETNSRVLEEFSSDAQQPTLGQNLSPSSPQHPLEVANFGVEQRWDLEPPEHEGMGEQQISLGTNQSSEEATARKLWSWKRVRKTLSRWTLSSWYGIAISCSLLFAVQVFDSPAIITRFLDVHNDPRFYAFVTCMMFIMFSIFAILSYVFRLVFVLKHPRVFFSGCLVVASLFLCSWFFILFPSLSYYADNSVQREFHIMQLFFAVFMFVLAPVFFASISLSEYLLYYLQPSIRSLALGFTIANSVTLVFLSNSGVFIVTSLFEKSSLWRYYLFLLSLSLSPLLVRSIQCLFYPKWICSRLRTLRSESKELLLTSVLLFVLLLLNVIFLLHMGNVDSNLRESQDPEIVSLEASGLNPPLRVMTYNIQMGFDRRGEMNWEGLLDIIRTEDPDILGLQETATYDLTKGNADIVDWLSSRTNLSYYYAGAKAIFSSVAGLALLSKYPLVGLQTNFLDGGGPYDVFIQGEILLSNGKSVKLYVLHTCCTHEEIAHQLEQITNQVREQLTSQQLRIIMGDFNMMTNDTGLVSMRRIGFHDSFFDIFNENEMSLLSTNLEMDKRIDMIWLDSTLKAKSAHIVGFSDCTICREDTCQPLHTNFRQSPCLDCITCSVSDHLPVIVEIQ
ncbi:hypothetical protein Gasu2_27590 [Galdieria sulphuraria]|uniref:Endonuclease n=1 Tax=Galdieria sulphuraria TaxID=130081 RepID=M2XJK0_GALSU|nr:endonuclease [Galdieria sulphuraria]EME30292.1 endonuclease [Galdieria sulphuraria]GJD08457.1 hypothetical protein Gasu2_27590 [Galdieria sulphuraria]|eukprot:XP_005706812.1 endonuclease [Galdieria sulphuraria]